MLWTCCHTCVCCSGVVKWSSIFFYQAVLASLMPLFRSALAALCCSQLLCLKILFLSLNGIWTSFVTHGFWLGYTQKHLSTMSMSAEFLTYLSTVVLHSFRSWCSKIPQFVLSKQSCSSAEAPSGRVLTVFVKGPAFCLRGLCAAIKRKGMWLERSRSSSAFPCSHFWCYSRLCPVY